MKIYFRILSITVILFLLSAGCEEILSDLLTFDSDYYIIDFEVDPIDKTGYHIFTEEIAKSDLDSLLEANGVSKEKLEEVHVKEAVLKITDSDASITFDPLEKISVTIYTEELKEKTIISIDHIPDGSRELEPVLDEDDIKDYLFEDEFILSAIGVLEERTYKTIPVQAKVKFEFRAGLKE
jgi:ribosome maturation factor RimP